MLLSPKRVRILNVKAKQMLKGVLKDTIREKCSTKVVCFHRKENYNKRVKNY